MAVFTELSSTQMSSGIVRRFISLIAFITFCGLKTHDKRRIVFKTFYVWEKSSFPPSDETHFLPV